MQPDNLSNTDEPGAQQTAATSTQPDIAIMLLHAAAWIAEHALFAPALIIVLPAPRSEDKSISMSLRHVWIASAMMTVSFLITWLRKQSSLASALLKSAIFLTFAYVLHAVLTMFAGARP